MTTKSRWLPVLIRQFQCKYVRGLYYMRDRSCAVQKHDYACETTPTHARTTHITAGGTMQVSLKGSRTERGERFIFIFVWRVLNENGSRRLCSFALLHFYFFFSKVPLCCCRYKRRDTSRDYAITPMSSPVPFFYFQRTGDCLVV